MRHAYESSWNSKAAARAALVFCALSIVVGCQSKSTNGHPAPLAKLAAERWLVELDVPGFGKAALAVPLGATTPQAIVIALHGAQDRPEWACSTFRAIAGPRGFVLCPRGVARADSNGADPRYTFGSADDTARELRAALAELKRRFGDHVAKGPVVFAGFEIGADHVAWIAPQEPAFFSRLLLISPSANSWTSTQSALFGRAGGRRVLFASGPSERAELEQRALLIARTGVEARYVALSEADPALDAPTRRALTTPWHWLAAPLKNIPTLDNSVNIAGNPLSADGPSRPLPAP